MQGLKMYILTFNLLSKLQANIVWSDEKETTALPFGCSIMWLTLAVWGWISVIKVHLDPHIFTVI